MLSHLSYLILSFNVHGLKHSMRHIPRFYCPDDLLKSDATIRLSEQAAHHVRVVLRGRDGDAVRLFNPRDGEWSGSLVCPDKKHADIILDACLGQAEILPDVTLILAPLKNKDSFDNAIRHAVELGVAHIQLVQTARTQQTKLNMERLQQQVIDAVQQCGRLTVPHVHALTPLAIILKQASAQRPILACVEGQNGQAQPLMMVADAVKQACAILIGPEGGFSDDEKKSIYEAGENVIPVSLGGLILRSDTAVAAALSKIIN
jgi:16S rRNA (uracil1498-N3)-methyltransferase